MLDQPLFVDKYGSSRLYYISNKPLPVRVSVFVRSIPYHHGNKVEVIDGHRLRTASGQLNTNPYVVLTINGDVFARSATARGTTRPVWSSEIFRVKLPPPLTGEWHRNEQEYFQGYRCVRIPLPTSDLLPALTIISPHTRN